MYILSEKKWKKIALVNLLAWPSRLFWELTDKSIKKYISNWKKILFITNRKWFSSSNICKDCGYIPRCKHCSIPIAKYKNQNQFIHMCPICKRIYENTWICQKCWGTNIIESWIWTYKLQEILQEKYNIKSFIIENTDINSKNKILKTQKEIQNKQFIISTNIFSQYSKNFIPDLIIFFNADTWLSIPDFNVWEKHFLFLYEFIKKYPTSNFIIQTYDIEHYVYKYILQLDLDWFWEKELEYRKQFNYPPFSEIVVLKYKNEIEESLYRKMSKLESELKYLIEKENIDIEIYQTPQLVYKKFWKYNYNIIIKWKDIKPFFDQAIKRLRIKEKWFQIDWLPNNLI